MMHSMMSTGTCSTLTGHGSTSAVQGNDSQECGTVKRKAQKMSHGMSPIHHLNLVSSKQPQEQQQQQQQHL
jgi:hypothetical protein